MHRLVVLVAAASLLAGCTTRYTIERDQLREARSRGAPAVPAHASDGRPTWLEVEDIRHERLLCDHLVEVDASDARPALRIGGWSMLVYGALTLGTGLANMNRSVEPGSSERGLQGLFVAAMGGVIAVAGGALLIPGYAADGPEVPLPPATTARAPPR